MAAGILREWARGTLSRRRNGESYPVAFLRLIASNRPRYGGYIVHLAVVALALGIAGSSFYDVQRDVILAPGESVEVGGYRIEYTGTRTGVRSDRTEFLNDLQVSQGNGAPWPMMAWRALYPAQNIAATRAAIRSTPIEDLYIVSSEFTGRRQGRFQNTGQPTRLVDVAGRADTCPGNARCAVAAAGLLHCQNAEAG